MDHCFLDRLNVHHAADYRMDLHQRQDEPSALITSALTSSATAAAAPTSGTTSAARRSRAR
jgi:hypothetical protein